jgi:hypothetical protein
MVFDRGYEKGAQAVAPDCRRRGVSFVTGRRPRKDAESPGILPAIHWLRYSLGFGPKPMVILFALFEFFCGPFPLQLSTCPGALNDRGLYVVCNG